MFLLSTHASKFHWRGLIFGSTLFFLFSISSTAYSQKKESSFSVRLMNIESNNKDPFRFNATLHNGSFQQQVYQLNAQAPKGWTVVFNAEGNQVAALQLDSGKTEPISIAITASPMAKPGKYEIPVSAVAGMDSLQLKLEAVLSGSYGLNVTTPSGKLSENVTEGNNRSLELLIQNTGTLPLNGVELSAQAPNSWNATFDTSMIARLDPGQSQQVKVNIAIPEKTIAGDYLLVLTAKNVNADSSASIRMTVKTSLLSGWLGILIILLAIGLVYFLIRKYGRR